METKTKTETVTPEVIIGKNPSEDFRNLVEAKQATAINQSAETVAIALEKFVDEGRITASEKGLVLWFFGHCKDRRLSLAECGKEIHYNAATVSRLFRGNYEGSLDNVMKAIRSYKQIIDERAKMSGDEFIETSIWKSIRSTCELALLRHAPVRVIGVSQIGKTCALLEYKRRSEYLVRYVRIPAAPSFKVCVEAIANACGVTTRGRVEETRKRVVQSLDHNTLLIVDELHELAISAGPTVAMRVMEWIRELYDVSGCGLVVCGTKVMEDDLMNGPAAGWLDQFQQRCIKVLSLPNRLPDTDIILTAKTYGFPEPPETYMIGLRELRMNRLTVALNLASDVAAKRDQPKTWELFAATLKAAFGKDILK